MKKTRLSKAVAMAIAGTALTAGGVSTASAGAVTMYNVGWHENGGVPCAPCSAGETDGWVWGGVGSSSPGDPNAATGWVGTSGPTKTPFGYIGGRTLNWAADFSSSGSAIISNADSIARYGKSADIDTAQGAWSDANLSGAAGWRHDLDFGLFKSDVDVRVNLSIKGVNFTNTNFGFTIFKGQEGRPNYNHHGAWNAGNNAQPGAPTAASLPGGASGPGLTFSVSDIVAYSIGGASPSNLNEISFNAKAGQVYTIALGGYKEGFWGDTVDGYVLNIKAVPEPASLSLFGIALASMAATRRRRAYVPA